MKFCWKCELSYPFLRKPWNGVKQILSNRIFQYQVTVAADFIRQLLPTFCPLLDKTAQHLLPVDKQPQIRAFVIITHKIAIQTHRRTARGCIRHQVV